MAGSYFRIDGAEELDKKLAKMPSRVQTQVVSKALRPAAKLIWMDAKQRLRAGGYVKTGNLVKSIGVAFRRYKRGALRMAVIGPRMPKGAHAHLLEFGTKERYAIGKSMHATERIRAKIGKMLGSKRYYRGKIDPKKLEGIPFMRPAFHKNRRRAKTTMIRGLQQAIKQAAR